MAKKKNIENSDVKPKVRAIQKISFAAWFQSKVEARVVKSQQVNEITVFFGKQGLKDKEEIEIFEKNLKRFLGK